VVTGASSGVGRALSIALAQEGATVYGIGRNSTRLEETVAAARKFSSAVSIPTDLSDESGVLNLVRQFEEKDSRVDILVHSAGVIHQDPLERARVEDLDSQYAVNVRAPYVLTQGLLPSLLKARGQVVFINSSVGLSVRRADVGQYSATKHALKAIADSLREEVNPQGIRVLSVYLGRTATPMQEALSRQEGRAYVVESLLQPTDVASVVLNALMLPPTAEVTDISIRPMIKG